MQSLVAIVESSTAEERKTLADLLIPAMEKKSPKTSRKPRTSKSKVSGQPFDPSMCWARCHTCDDEDLYGKGGEATKNIHAGLRDHQCTGKIIDGSHYCSRHGGKGPGTSAVSVTCQDEKKLFLGDYGKMDEDENPVNLPRPENPTRMSKKALHKYICLLYTSPSPRD